jgi:FMN phosphatase YigB (HAD superfamily)
LPGEIACVGDRADNDVGPAAEAGLVAVFLRRGPWAIAQEGSAQAAKAHLRVGSLSELPRALLSPGAGGAAAGITTRTRSPGRG